MKRNRATLVLALTAGMLALSCSDEPEITSLSEPGPTFAVTGTPNKQFWKQCQNNQDYADDCDWTTGNLNQTHNTWAEGDFVPKVLRINSITNGDPFEIEMTYGFLKGGFTTHDFLGVWNLTQTNANPCTDIRFNVSPFCTGGAFNHAGLVDSNLMDALSITAVTNACPTRPQMVTDMGEAIAAAGAGNLIIQGLRVESIVVDSIKFDGCPLSGDAEAFLYMTVDPIAAAAGDANSPGIMLLFGAHVARSFDWDNGGAAGVEGSPYHLGLVTVDGESAGSMDLQMAANAIVVPGTKSGRKFNDLNADGDDEGGTDPNLTGWTIKVFADADDDEVLEDADDGTADGLFTPVDSYVTDASGYTFTLLPGNYIVCEVLQATWTQSAPDPATANCSADATLGDDGYDLTITEGSVDTGNDFGNYQNGTKSGRKFNDLNGDGDDEGGTDPNLTGWTIKVFADADNDGVLEDGDDGAVDATFTAVASDVTDGSGYSFSLAPGNYIVCEVLQTGWTQTAPDPGSADCSADTTLGDEGYDLTISSGSTETGNDFGNFQNGTKSGRKFNDLNADGDDEGGSDPNLTGWTIKVFADADNDGVLEDADDGAADATFTAVASDVTDGSGYSFSLAPGNYIVCEVLQAGWMQTAPDPGSADCSADTTLGDEGYDLTITSGSTDTGNDFGNAQAGTKSGRKFNDLNADGDDEGGTDPNLTGWTIKAFADADNDGVLEDADDGAVDATFTAVATDVTDGSGYSFSLAPGNYIVCEVLQTGWTQSAPDPGSADCSADTTLGDEGYDVTITSGSTETGNDFGNFQNGTKSGRKFKDLNADGDDEGGSDPNLTGWTIKAFADADNDGVLEDADDGAADATFTAVATDVTDGSGYSFSLAPGNYIVCEVLQTGWTQSAPDPGSADCSADTTLGDEGYDLTITSGSTETGNDFGNFENGTKSGRKFNDVNGDGDDEAGADPNLIGWTIRAFKDADNDGVLEDADDGATDGAFTAFATDVTDGSGYSFSLPPGNYIVCEVLQATWVQTAPNPGTADCSADPTLGDAGYDVTITSGSTETGNDFGNNVPVTDQTAWASNSLACNGQLPYPGSNWATYVAYNNVAKTVSMCAGQTNVAGTVTFSGPPVSNRITITINLVGYTFAPGSVVKIQGYANVGQIPSNPAPGQFNITCVPTNATTAVCTNILARPFFGVHAVVIED